MRSVLSVLLASAVAAAPDGGAVRDAGPVRPSVPSRAASPTTEPLEVMARLPERPGAIAVTPEGRVFVAAHPLALAESALGELRGGRLAPYPSGVLSRGFGAVSALAATPSGALWILDAGSERVPAALLGWNTRDERRLQTLRLPAAVLRPESSLAALVVDEARGLAVVADRTRADWTSESHPALVVVDLASGRARRVLEDHPALEPDAVPLVVDGHALAHREPGGTVERLRLGVGALAVDPPGEWLYLLPITGGTLWRVRLADLADPGLAPAQLADRVESHADRPPGTGLVALDGGRCVTADPAGHALVTVAPGGVAVLARDARLLWPDGLALGPGGWLWATVNQLHLHPALNRGVEQSRPPYLVVRVRLPAAPARLAPVPEPATEGEDGDDPR